MTLKALSNDQEQLVIGQLWKIVVESSSLPTLVVLLPDGTTLNPPIAFELDTTQIACGIVEYVYAAELPPQEPGRYIAAVTATDESGILLQAWVSEVTQNTDLPSVDSLNEWMGGSGSHSFTDDELTEALDIAGQQQRDRCRVPAALPATLREAWHRRAARHLYLRRQLTESPRTDADFDTPPTFPPGRDFTVRELEHHYLKTPIG